METLKSETNHQIFRLCGLTNLMDDLKKKKTIANIFPTPGIYVCHFMAIYDFTLMLPSGNAQHRPKSLIFGPMWPWNLIDDLQNP